MVVLDAHCDTLSLMVKDGLDLSNEKLNVNLKEIKKLNGYVQFFASFINCQSITKDPLIYVLKMIDKMYEVAKRYQEHVEIAYNYDDIQRITTNNRCAGILWLEGANALNGEVSVLRMLYRLGLRGIGLTWNQKNELACGVEEYIDTGISKLGYEIIDEMNKLGIIIDVSHLGELGFWHVMNYCSKPIVASHSNARSICNHKRNLTKEQIEAIAKNNGVIGINFYPIFLNNTLEASMDDIIKHIEYISSLVGTKHIGFGSDFDGIEIVPKEINGPSKIVNVLNELAKLNYSQEQIEDIAGNNFLRVVKEVIG